MRRMMRNSDKELMLSKQAEIELNFAEIEEKKAALKKAMAAGNAQVASNLETEINAYISEIEEKIRIVGAMIGYE